MRAEDFNALSENLKAARFTNFLGRDFLTSEGAGGARMIQLIKPIPAEFPWSLLSFGQKINAMASPASVTIYPGHVFMAGPGGSDDKVAAVATVDLAVGSGFQKLTDDTFNCVYLDVDLSSMPATLSGSLGIATGASEQDAIEATESDSDEVHVPLYVYEIDSGKINLVRICHLGSVEFFGLFSP